DLPKPPFVGASERRRAAFDRPGEKHGGQGRLRTAHHESTISVLTVPDHKIRAPRPKPSTQPIAGTRCASPRGSPGVPRRKTYRVNGTEAPASTSAKIHGIGANLARPSRSPATHHLRSVDGTSVGVAFAVAATRPISNARHGSSTTERVTRAS